MMCAMSDGSSHCFIFPNFLIPQMLRQLVVHIMAPIRFLQVSAVSEIFSPCLHTCTVAAFHALEVNPGTFLPLAKPVRHHESQRTLHDVRELSFNFLIRLF